MKYAYRIESVKLSTMFVDPRAQRSLDEGHVQRIIDNFKEEKVGLLHVSDRDNEKFAIIDGQHRHAALIDAYEEWECIVYEDLTLEQEADLFVGLNDTKYVSPMHKFHARATAGDPVVLEIKEAARKQGWEIPRTPSHAPGRLSAVSALLDIYHSATRANPKDPEAGRRHVEKVVSILTQAWGHKHALAVSSSMLRGVHTFLGRYGSHAHLDIRSLVNDLSRYTNGPNGFYGHARGRADQDLLTLAAAVAAQLTAVHNKHKRSLRLPDWRS